MKIWLKYGAVVKTFTLIRSFCRPHAEKSNSVSLRGFIYERNKFNRRAWEITINTTSIKSDTDYDFLITFFCSSDRQLSFDGATFRDVYIEGEEFPVSFIEDCRYLPEVTFKLISKVPDASALPGEPII